MQLCYGIFIVLLQVGRRSKSFIGKDLNQIKWKSELNYVL